MDLTTAEDQERSDEKVRDGLALQTAVAAVREHLKAFGTEPYGDLAVNADRAAVIAVAALEAAGWRPQDDEMLAEEFRKGFEAGEVNSALLNEDVRRVVRRLCGRIIASAHLLDVPFTDAPDQSPWTRMKRDMAALHEAVGIRFANLPNEGGE